MASDIDWTEETIARLRALWAEGHSTAEIGRRMGTSKNAIIGKAHRLHLPPRASPIRGKGTGNPRKPAVPRVRGPSLPPLAAVAGSTPATPASPPAAQPRPAIPVPAPAPQPATVFKPPASKQSCCWPIGEPGTRGFRYCDGPAAPGKPYCAEHSSQAYVAPRAARDRPDGRMLDRYLQRELTRTT